MSAGGDKRNHSGTDSKPQGRDSGDADQGSAADATPRDAEGLDVQGQAVPKRKGQAREERREPVARGAGTGGLLPDKAAEDDPRRWGDQPGSYDHDAWLKEQRPPHWG